MLFDERVDRALAAIARPLAAYRSAVTTALARVRHALASSEGSDRVAQELGVFARQRIDLTRFAALSHGTALDASTRIAITRAADVLDELSKLPDEAFVIEVRSGSLIDAVAPAALSTFGCAFGAARAADLLRTGRFNPAEHDGLTSGWPFTRWTRDERRVSPPLVLTSDGHDLHAASLAPILDGSMHVVLVVRGDCPPASLVRLITPGTLVLQTSDATGLDRFAEFTGPAIAALVPEGAAHFLHDPERGRAAWQRLTTWGAPPTDPRKGIAGLSANQQREELRQLESLLERPAFPETSIDALAPAGVGDPADRLASWLLDQSGLGTV